ncbi:MAG: EamA/RhaT family transporter [Tissierellia bacterium]|nr:EamA/RhaT family transporter [Tissierellia bacterium]
MTFAIKRSEAREDNRYGVLIFNYLLAILMSYGQLGGAHPLLPAQEGFLTFGLAGLNGILYMVSLFLLQYSIRKNGPPLTSTFNRLGVLIPTLASIFVFMERPSFPQGIGLALAFGAILMINGGESVKKGGSRLALLALLVLGGSIDLLSKIFHTYGNSAYTDHYMFYTFVVSFVIAVVLFIKEGQALTRSEVISGVLIGIPNQLCSLSLLKAAALLPAYFVFPVNSAGIILLVNLVNYFVFKEKLTSKEMGATGLIVLALFFLNA